MSDASITGQETQLSFLVLSDLHCHPDVLPRDSFLIAGAKRIPITQHPIESLLKLISDESIRTDAIVVPGDLCNKASLPGLSQAWEHVLEIQRACSAEQVVCTVGNHDIDSRKQNGPDPLDLAKTFRPGFPLESEDDNRRFWQDGYCLLSPIGNAEFLVLNSALDHHDEETARRGTFSQTRIEALDEYLAKQPLRALRVAVLHHHTRSFIRFPESQMSTYYLRAIDF